MPEKETYLAIIPARGGSKRLPGKNILEFDGKPLIAWSIEAALKSQYINKVIVSSDSEEILWIAEKFGANIMQRPSVLSNDTATTFGVIQHVIENIDTLYDYVVLLQPTSPLRNERHINEAIELLKSKNADAVISVCEMEHSPEWSNVLPADGNMKAFLKKEVLNKRSQDLETYYRLNGSIYIAKTKKLISEKSFFLEENIYAYKMSRNYSIDIDEKIDFELAKVIKSLM